MDICKTNGFDALLHHFFRKTMYNLLNLTQLKLIFALVSLGIFGCKDQSQPSSPDTDQLLAALLIRSDSIAEEALPPQFSLLPAAYQDSFFIKRISRLQTLGQYDALRSTLDLYKKWKPGLLSDCNDHFFQAVSLQYAGKFDSAQHEYARAIATCEQLGDLRFLANILDASSGNLATQGRHDEAMVLKYLAVAAYKAHEKELKIAALEREKSLAAQSNWWIFGLLMLLFSVVFYGVRLNATREHQRLEAEKAKAEAQSLKLQQELYNQKIKLAANQTSLENYAQMLIGRNEQLNELALQIELGRGQKEPNQHSEIVNLYEQVILTESDWDNFQFHFNNMYPGYISDLRTRYPNLTPSEIRLVLMDKMGLSLKETSSILGTSIDAIKKGRYRLKKKYNLRGENISDMI